MTSHFRNVVGDTALVEAVHTLPSPIPATEDNPGYSAGVLLFTCSPAQRTLGIREAGEFQGRLAFKDKAVTPLCCLVTCFAESVSLHFICTRLAAQQESSLKAKLFSQPCRLLGFLQQGSQSTAQCKLRPPWLLALGATRSAQIGFSCEPVRSCYPHGKSGEERAGQMADGGGPGSGASQRIGWRT